jgi:hypothetical protein
MSRLLPAVTLQRMRGRKTPFCSRTGKGGSDGNSARGAAEGTPTAHAGDLPHCGQESLDHEAVRRVHESDERHQREVDAAAKAKAAKLAEELTRKKDAQHRKLLGRVERQLEAEHVRRAEEHAHYKEALREQKATLRAEAEREAATRVRGDLRSKELLIAKLKSENEEQNRQIERLAADERGELNEEALLMQLQAAFPDDRIERLGRGRAAATSCTRSG